MKINILIILIFSSSIFAQDNIKYAETISNSELKKHILTLTSDTLEGRETGRLGQKKAANYIAEYFKKIGIPPSVKERNRYTKRIEISYFQKFRVKSTRHLCKCDDCDVDFIKDILGVKRWIEGENVLGYIEGSDLKDELVIITAHYDHLGKHDTLIFPGADGCRFY